MLLKHRSPDIDTSPVRLQQGLEHLDQSSIAVLRWLNTIKLDYVVVGPVAHAIRGDSSARGPVGIVPAPYGRNFERLANALIARHAGLRSDRGRVSGPGSGEVMATVPVKLSADKLARGRRWMLRFDSYDLDVEGAGKGAAGARGVPDGAASAPGYQELLYEAGRFQLAEGISVEVASPEDLEHFSHVRRTGTAPEFVVTRTAAPDPDPASDPDPGSTMTEAGPTAPAAEGPAGADAPDPEGSGAHRTDSSADS